jgi:hypothetical protein
MIDIQLSALAALLYLEEVLTSCCCWLTQKIEHYALLTCSEADRKYLAEGPG